MFHIFILASSIVKSISKVDLPVCVGLGLGHCVWYGITRVHVVCRYAWYAMSVLEVGRSSNSTNCFSFSFKDRTWEYCFLLSLVQVWKQRISPCPFYIKYKYILHILGCKIRDEILHCLKCRRWFIIPAKKGLKFLPLFHSRYTTVANIMNHLVPSHTWNILQQTYLDHTAVCSSCIRIYE